VTRNLCLSHLTRRRSRWKLFSEFDPEEGEAEAQLADRLSEPSHSADQAESRDRREALSAALERLPAAQRVALVLYHFHELSYEDIAAQLKVSLSKVKTDIHRARLALRRRLEGEQRTLLH
jgi:RNA polymerase sigma-70 factor (ECF subfamily)